MIEIDRKRENEYGLFLAKDFGTVRHECEKKRRKRERVTRRRSRGKEGTRE